MCQRGLDAAWERVIAVVVQPLPLSLLSQYAPGQYERIQGGALANTPGAIVGDKIAAVLNDYAYACGRDV
jgi:tagatose-1,6-bisphosphate aldolase non-catalytic subunit AgaZ/GatZ